MEHGATWGPDEPDTRAARLGRLALWIGLILAWMAMVAYMWDAVTTIPPADRLAESRLIEIPGPATFITATIFSAFELGVVLGALWPWRPGYFATRLAITILALVTWFITTTPLRELSRMDWVHRRWLAFMVVALGGALLVVAGRRLAARWAGSED